MLWLFAFVQMQQFLRWKFRYHVCGIKHMLFKQNMRVRPQGLRNAGAPDIVSTELAIDKGVLK